MASPHKSSDHGLNLRRFLEIQYKQKFLQGSDDYCCQWSKGFDYSNWFIVSVIGTGAYAKVFLVKQVKEDEEGVVREKYFAMKEIRKTKVQDI